MKNIGLHGSGARLKITERNSNKISYSDDSTLMAESEEELKSLLMKVKEEREKAGLNLNIKNTKIKVSSPIASWQIDWEKWWQWQTLFSWAPKSPQRVTADTKLKDALWKKNYDKPRQWIKQRHHFVKNVCIVKAMVFFSSHVRMWELDHKEGWVLKKWCFPTLVLEKTLESPLESKKIKPVNFKWNQL